MLPVLRGVFSRHLVNTRARSPALRRSSSRRLYRVVFLSKAILSHTKSRPRYTSIPHPDGDSRWLTACDPLYSSSMKTPRRDFLSSHQIWHPLTISSGASLADACSMPTASPTIQSVACLFPLAESCPWAPAAQPLPDPDLDPDRLEANTTSKHREQFVQTNRAQIAQIKNHHKWMLRVSCENVTLDEAASDWIRNHAALWRSDYEAITA